MSDGQLFDTSIDSMPQRIDWTADMEGIDYEAWQQPRKSNERSEQPDDIGRNSSADKVEQPEVIDSAGLSTTPRPSTVQSENETIPALLIGGRVYFEEPTNTGIVLDVDAENNLTQVAFDLDPEKPIWVATEFLSTVTYSPASPGSAGQHNLSGESPQLSLSKITPMRSQSSERISLVSPSTVISETTTLDEEISTLSPVASPVQAHPTLGRETDSGTPPQHYGEKESDASSSADQDSWLLSNLKVLSDEDFKQFLRSVQLFGLRGQQRATKISPLLYKGLIVA